MAIQQLLVGISQEVVSLLLQLILLREAQIVLIDPFILHRRGHEPLFHRIVVTRLCQLDLKRSLRLILLELFKGYSRVNQRVIPISHLHKVLIGLFQLCPGDLKLSGQRIVASSQGLLLFG